MTVPALCAAALNPDVTPRPVTLAGCLDAARATIPDERVKELYASSNLQQRAAENWSAEALLSLL